MSNNTWLSSYIDSPEKQRQLYRRTLIIVVISQIFGGAGLAAGVTVGALLAQDMLGTDSFAGVSAALFTLGSAGAALLVGGIGWSANWNGCSSFQLYNTFTCRSRSFPTAYPSCCLVP